MRCSLLVTVALPLVRALPQRPVSGNTNAAEMTGTREEFGGMVRDFLKSHQVSDADVERMVKTMDNTLFSDETGPGNVEGQVPPTVNVAQNDVPEKGNSNDLGPSNPPADPAPPTLDNFLEATGGRQPTAPPPTSAGKRPTAGPSTPQGPAGNNGPKDGQSPESNSTSGKTAANYLDIINEWRKNLKRPGLQTPLKQDTTLEKFTSEASAQSTKDNLQHTHNSNGQVMAPVVDGNPENFKKVFLGGWICEIESLAEEAGERCSDYNQGYIYLGQTGHAEILSDPQYTHIGCALVGEVWTCDLSIGGPGSQNQGGAPFGGSLPRGGSILQGF